MAPPSADDTTLPASEHNEAVALSSEAEVKKTEMLAGINGPKYQDPYKEREYQKGRLALAFRIFAKFGFDEGVAGHITLRVKITSKDS